MCSATSRCGQTKETIPACVLGGNHLAGWDRLGITANSYLCGPDVPKSIISFGTPKFVIELRAHVPSFILGYLKYHRVRSKNGYPKNSLVYDQHDQGDQHMGL